jgi:hypothetical protein
MSSYVCPAKPGPTHARAGHGPDAWGVMAIAFAAQWNPVRRILYSNWTA